MCQKTLENSYLAHCEHRCASLYENCFVIILSCVCSEEINDNCYIHNSLIEILKKEAIVNGLLSTRARIFVVISLLGVEMKRK